MRVKRYQAVPFQQVDLDQGFWQERQRINRDVSIWNVYKRFQETGRFDAFRCDWREGMPNKPHVFWDSDVAKWMEAAAFLLEKKPDPQLEAAVDELVDRIADHQDAWTGISTPISPLVSRRRALPAGRITSCTAPGICLRRRWLTPTPPARRNSSG